MVKHKRWSDKPKSDTPPIDEEKNVVKQETSIEKESKDIKSLIVSGTKYIYIITVAALLAGVFTPITTGIEIENVLFGVLSLLLGLGGGVLIILGLIKKHTALMVLAGLGLIIISTVIIYELSNDSLLG